MGQHKIEYIKLSKENIGSFEDYLPATVIVRIALEGVYGYGVAVDDYASGVALCEKNDERDELWLLWLYVDEECRGLGIGDALYKRLLEESENMSAVCVRYLFPIHEQMEDYLINKGFRIYSKIDEDPEEDENELHIAKLELGDEQELTDDRWAMENIPDAGYIMPRLFEIKGKIDDMELNSEIIAPSGNMPGICVLRGQEEPPVDIYVLMNNDNREDYAVSLRISLDVNEDEMERTRSLIKGWDDKLEITSTILHVADETIDFIATMPVESDRSLQPFGDFYKAFINETDSCLVGL